MPDDAATSGEEPLDVVYLRPLPPANRVERFALIAGLTAGVVLAALVGWLGFRAYEAHNLEAQRNLFVQTASQSAVNLLTVDYQHADADAQRILDSATGKFHDNFARRKQSYIDHAKRARAKSVATVTDAAFDTRHGDQGWVLVAVKVTSADPAQAQQEPQYWRIRIGLQRIGDVAKVSDVEFV